MWCSSILGRFTFECILAVGKGGFTDIKTQFQDQGIVDNYHIFEDILSHKLIAGTDFEGAIILKYQMMLKLIGFLGMLCLPCPLKSQNIYIIIHFLLCVTSDMGIDFYRLPYLYTSLHLV